MKAMKKVLGLCLAAMALLVLAACTGNNASGAATASTDISGAVLLDCEAVMVTAKGMEKKDDRPMLRVTIENKLDQTVWVSAKDVSVNGYMDLNPMFVVAKGEGVSYQQSWEVPAKYSGDEYGLMLLQGMPKDAGITEVGDLETTLYAGKSEFETDYVGNPVALHVADVQQAYNEEGTVVLDNDQVKIVVRDTLITDEFMGSLMGVYAHNKTDETIAITLEDVQANGSATDAAYSAFIAPGKRDISTVSFTGVGPEDALKEVKCTFVGRIFREADDDTVTELFRSDPVTLSF